jgi:hypothetical protein
VNKFTRAFAVTVVAIGLVAGPTAAANAATVSQPNLNNCQYVTVKPKLSGPICWNVFGLYASLPAGCYPTKVWKCYQV